MTPAGGEIRVASATAASIDLVVWDGPDAGHPGHRVPLARDAHGVWSARTHVLRPGAHYTLRADGPREGGAPFDPALDLLDPYARGLARTPGGGWRARVPADDAFDWGGVERPSIPLDHVVLYEAHVRGLTMLHPGIPEELRGTYAGLASDAAIEYLTGLGVTTVELLPVHQFVSERRLQEQGRVNYWGYNTLHFFTPHDGYATRSARREGADAVLREFRGMVRRLHEAGLQVVLDVVYNHTAEEGQDGPTTSLRGLDDVTYYRHDAQGHYLDTTGCGNTLDASQPVVQRLVLDSMRYWASEAHVDGFRLDLAATLARDADARFDPAHALLTAMRDDPVLGERLLIAEPWDVGPGGWQVGRFPAGFSEWNDGFRDRMRDFWLTDVAAARARGVAPVGIGPMARRLTGSAHVFSEERGPLASINFVTAHDGFTMADLTAYDVKHNEGNGEDNRDGTDANHSYNHGVEGPSDDPAITAVRRKAMRNLLGTLLLSAGVPMLTAGDEFGRSQRGNNNAYCQDGELTWLRWEREPWQEDLLAITRHLIRMRRENPAVRPVRYGRWGETVPSATQMDWYNKEGLAMTLEDWDSPVERTLQYLAASTPEFEPFNRILLVVHGLEEGVTVTLPEHEGVGGYTLLWDSARDALDPDQLEFGPGSDLVVAPTSMQLFRAHPAP